MPTVPSIPKMSSPAQFIKEVIAELKKVNWPTREETMKLTVVVIAIMILVGIFIGALDTTFLRISTLLYKR